MPSQKTCTAHKKEDSMKSFSKSVLAFLLAAVLLISGIPTAFAGTAITSYDFRALASENEGLAFDVAAYDDGDTYYIMLPSNFTGDFLTVTSRKSISSISGETSVDKDNKKFTMGTSDGATVRVNSKAVTVMRTSLPALSITIDSGYSLETIHASKDEKIKAHARIDGADTEEYNLVSTQIEMKTRGNTTFGYIKKPYQIKFEKKTSLFGMPKAKKWILLANYLDGTGIKSKLAFETARQLGMSCAAESQFVDLYIDGEYNGMYQLIEKNEVGSGRVDLNDECGVILEMESTKRVESDDIYIVGDYSKKPYVFKDYVTDIEDTTTPEATELSLKVQETAYTKINEFEEVLYSADSTWEEVASHIDVDSFIQYYFVNELCMQIDCMLASTYFYFDGEADVIHCGPIWDFDRICGFQTDCEQSTNSDFCKNLVESTDAYRCDIYKQLFRYLEFVEIVNNFYEDTAKDVLSEENIMSMIDGYQNQIWDSLMANFTRWFYIFSDISTTMDNILPDASFEEQVNYVTDEMKTWLKARIAYLETAYGANLPTLTYSVYGAFSDTTLTWPETYDEQWHPAVSGGSMTYGATVKGIELNIEKSNVDGSVSLTVYDGYTTKNVSEGESYRSNYPLIGISATLSGNLANYFDIEYRVLQNRGITTAGYKGWTSWKKNGTVAGSSSGKSSRYAINKIQIRLIAKKDIEYGSVNLSVNGKTLTETGIIGNTFTPSAPEVKGYTFEGWYITPDYAGTPITTVGFTQSPMTLYAKLEANGIKGDVDGNGIVTTRDLIFMKYYIKSYYTEEDIVYANADINGDGIITMSDYAALRRILTAK